MSEEFSQRDLAGARFEWVDLTGASFELVYLRGARFERVDFTGAKGIHPRERRGAAIRVKLRQQLRRDRHGSRIAGRKVCGWLRTISVVRHPRLLDD